jgi:hypothetical protein
VGERALRIGQTPIAGEEPETSDAGFIGARVVWKKAK